MSSVSDPADVNNQVADVSRPEKMDGMDTKDITKFGVLIEMLQKGEASNREVVNTVLHLRPIMNSISASELKNGTCSKALEKSAAGEATDLNDCTKFEKFKPDMKNEDFADKKVIIVEGISETIAVDEKQESDDSGYEEAATDYCCSFTPADRDRFIRYCKQYEEYRKKSRKSRS